MASLQNKYRRKQVFYKDLSEPDFGDWAMKLYENNDVCFDLDDIFQDNNNLCFSWIFTIENNNPDNIWQLYQNDTPST